MSTEGGTRAVIAALLANLGIAATKFLAFFLTGFSSMLAEAIHSVADSGNQILLLIGGKRSQREATPQHPFGFGRERYVYSFIVSIVLFTLGGCFALYESWHKFEETRGDSDYDPFESRWWWVPVVVLVVAIAHGGLQLPHRRARVEQAARLALVAAVRAQLEGARAAGHPARGLRRAHRPHPRPARRRADAAHRQPDLRRARLGAASACCSWSSPRSSRSR